MEIQIFEIGNRNVQDRPHDPVWDIEAPFASDIDSNVLEEQELAPALNFDNVEFLEDPE